MSSKVRVLIDTSPLETGHSARGIGMYTRQLIHNLQQRQDCQVLLSSDHPNSSEFDLVHYPYFDLFFPTLPLWKSKPTVVTIHDLIPLQFPKHYPVGMRGRWQWLRQQLSLRSVAAVITDSQASAGDIESILPFTHHKLHVTYLAGNPEISHQPQEEVAAVRKKYQVPTNYILYVGDINYNKNLPQLIKSLKYLPQKLKLVCVGTQFFPHPIPEWQAIEAQIALSDVADRVVFISQLASSANTDLAALYSGAQVYVQPSLYEGFGLPVLEAMQAQVPVVSTHNSSLIEVGADKVLFATDNSAAALAAAVEKVLSWDEKYRTSWTKRALAYSQTFSWQKTAQETVDVYRSLI